MEALTNPAIVTALITAAVTLGAARWTFRANLVNELRKALDRGRIRENALAVCCDLLLYAIDHIEDPAPAIIDLRARARDVLLDARRMTHGKEGQ